MNPSRPDEMPQDLGAETALLGCCILDGENVTAKRTIDNCKAAGLAAAAFYDHRNRVIYTKMLGMLEAGIKLAPAVLVEELKAAGQLEQAGGFLYISTLTDGVGSTAAAIYRIDRLNFLHQKRSLLAAQSAEELTAVARKMLEGGSRSGAQFDWVTVTAAELQANPPEIPEVLVEGVLYRGGTMMLCGPSKSHKTYTLLDLALAVAEGSGWLGFKTSPVPVLYVNLELQDHAVNKRLVQICSARGLPAPTTLHFCNLRGVIVTAGELARQLPKLIKQLGIGLVILDPHYKVSAASGAEENSNDQQGQLLAEFESMCGKNGAALVVAHHFAKGDSSTKNAIDRASGGGVMARWGDVMMTFTPHQEEEAMTVDMALRNFAPVPQFAVKWEHPRWSRDESLDPAKLKRASGRTEQHTAEDALKALDGPKGFAEWQRASGMSESTFRRKLRDLEDAGKVKKEGMFYVRKAA